MHVKMTPIRVDEKNPFAADKLGREKDVSVLEEIVRQATPPLTVAIDSPWGTGKTTLLRICEAQFRTSGIRTIFFNAWETDFAADPLVAFLSAIDEQLTEAAGKNPAVKTRLDTAKSVGMKVAKRALPAAAKALTFGALDTDAITEAAAGKATEGLTTDLLDAFNTTKDAHREFRRAVGALFEASEHSTPLVFLVDELDRCRPTYAIFLLERIKHLFDTGNLIFVLAVDMEQLSHSVQAVYGNGMDAKGYLRRFVDVDYRPRRPSTTDFVTHLSEALDLDSFFGSHARKSPEYKYEPGRLKSTIALAANKMGLSLRDIEQLMGRLSLSFNTGTEMGRLFPNLLAFLLATRMKAPERYQEYLQPNNGPEGMVAWLHELVPVAERHNFNENDAFLIEGMLIAGKLDPHDDSVNEALLGPYRHGETLANLSTKEQQYRKRVHSVATDDQRSLRRGIPLSYLTELIELYSEVR